jgi:hypothetical protein
VKKFFTKEGLKAFWKETSITSKHLLVGLVILIVGLLVSHFAEKQITSAMKEYKVIHKISKSLGASIHKLRKVERCSISEIQTHKNVPEQCNKVKQLKAEIDKRLSLIGEDGPTPFWIKLVRFISGVLVTLGFLITGIKVAHLLIQLMRHLIPKRVTPPTEEKPAATPKE